jgi:hypothetical protein
MRHYIYFLFFLNNSIANEEKKIDFKYKDYDLNKKEINTFQPPKEISLNFVKDTEIYFKETLNKYVYYLFISVNIITPLINIITLYGFEDSKEENKVSKYILTTTNILIALNLISSFKTKYFTYRVIFFVGNNFINCINFYILYNMKLKNSKVFYINTIIYIITTNISMAVSSIDKVLKLDVNKLLKEIQEDSEKEAPLVF